MDVGRLNAPVARHVSSQHTLMVFTHSRRMRCPTTRWYGCATGSIDLASRENRRPGIVMKLSGSPLHIVIGAALPVGSEQPQRIPSLCSPELDPPLETTVDRAR